MIDPDDFAAGWDLVFARGACDEVGEDVGQVAGTGADVQDAGGGMEKGEEGFTGGSVHVRGRDGGLVADVLRRVFVGCRGAVVSAVDLWNLIISMLVGRELE